jgi:hypothetical protein
MKHRLIHLVGAACLAALPLLANAQPARHAPPPRAWQFDDRFHHDHYYPAVGELVVGLPDGYLDLAFGRAHWFFRAGVWFKPYPGGRYVVAVPPAGIVIPVLPPAYSVVWVGPTPYYYANGVYYVAAAPNGYQVVAPPTEVVTAPPPGVPVPVPAPVPTPTKPVGGDGLFVYPRNQQTPLQAATDRHECDRWGQQQTGYDFERPESTDAKKLPDFQRAVIACLDARGYSVK